MRRRKKAAEQRKKQKVIVVKEIKLRPTIDKHDLEVKMRAVHKFIEDGDKVKFTLKFRGREIAHQELGMKLLEQVQAELLDSVKMEMHPRMEGRQLSDDGRAEVTCFLISKANLENMSSWNLRSNYPGSYAICDLTYHCLNTLIWYQPDSGI